MEKNQVTLKGAVDPQAACDMIMKRTKRRVIVVSPLLPAAEGEAAAPQVVGSQVCGSTTVELNVNMHCEACADQLKRKILKMRGVQTAVTELSSGKVTVMGTMDADKLVDYVYRRTRKQAWIVPRSEPERKEEKKEGEKPAEEPKAEEKREENGEQRSEDKPEEKKENKSEEGGSGESKEEEAEKEGKEAAAAAAMANHIIVDDEGMKRVMHYYQPLYVIERLPPPQLFSDENPNACCIS